MAEYKACIMGVKVAIYLRIKFLSVYGDSALVISQIKGEWDTKHPNLILYRILETSEDWYSPNLLTLNKMKILILKTSRDWHTPNLKIGRASCRERV